MHLWLSYSLSSQQGWITYHVIPGIKAKLITQVIIMLRSNDVLRGPYRFSRRRSSGETAWSSALTTGAASVLSGKKKMRSAAERELPSAVHARRRVIPVKSNLRPVIGLSAFTRFLITSSNARRLTLLSPGADCIWSLVSFNSPLCFISFFFLRHVKTGQTWIYLFIFFFFFFQNCRQEVHKN